MTYQIVFLFVTFLATCAEDHYATVEYTFDKRNNPCHNDKTAAALKDRLGIAISDIDCVIANRCDIDVNHCVKSNKSPDVRILITRSDDRINVNEVKRTVRVKLEPVISPYLKEKTACGPDRALINNSCGKCPPGSYMTGGLCYLCSVGTFSTSLGAADCIPCPIGTTTQHQGTSDPEGCEDICEVDITPGHNLNYSSTGAIVAGSTIVLPCAEGWAFDNIGTTSREVPCSDDLPKCDVRWCEDPCEEGYQCYSCQCVNTTTNAWCDRVQHCEDGSDEAYCPEPVGVPSSLQFRQKQTNHITVPKSWSRLTDVSVCTWARLKLSHKFSSLVSFEREHSHSLWLKLTKNALYIQLNKMIYKEIPLPYPLDRSWFSVCVSVEHDELDLFLDGVPLLSGEDRDISSVKGLEISGDVVLGGMVHDSHPAYSLNGLIKDLTVWDTPLTVEQVLEYSEGCMIPRSQDVVLEWGTIKNSSISSPDTFIIQSYSNTCKEPLCSGSCPPNMWQCGSCDCIPLQHRCDRSPGHCLDYSDEAGCPLLDGQMVLLEERQTSSSARDNCLQLGGSIALLSTDFITDYATKILMYYDYDKAWTLKPPLSAGVGLLTKLGNWMTVKEAKDDPGYYATEDEPTHAALCQISKASIYRYYETPVTYENARSTCQEMSGDLATIITRPQLQLLLSVIDSHQGAGLEPVWLGAAKRDGYLAWDNGDIFSDLDQDPKYISGNKLSLDRDINWELRNETESHPFVCMIHTAYNHTTSLVFVEEEEGVVKITDPLLGLTVLETTTCTSFRSAKANGTIISYATESNDNELLVMVTNQALVIMVHNVPFFLNIDLTDGYWHTLCYSYSTDTYNLNIFIDGGDWSIEREIDSTGTVMSGIMILGAEQDFMGSTTKLDQFQYFEGDIANFNMWGAVLSKEELKYLSTTSEICQSILTRDEKIVLRWGDVLNYATSSVSIGSMGDNEVCRSLMSDEEVKLKVGGVPLTVADDSFRLCREEEKCKEADLKLLSETKSGPALVGTRIKIVIATDESRAMSCSSSSCTLTASGDWDQNDVIFLLQSPVKRPGETLEPSDKFYFTDVQGAVVLRCTTDGCGAAKGRVLQDSLFSTVIEKRGWSSWEESGECEGSCGDSSKELVRTCLAPEELQSLYCAGSSTKRDQCHLHSCQKTDACVEGELKDRFRGTFRWNHVHFEHYSVAILCPAGNYFHREYPLNIKMQCKSDGFNKAQLRKNIKKCAFLSESAQLLYGLMEEDITASNVEAITSEMMTIMDNADDLSALHLEMISNLTDRALETGNVTLTVQDNIVTTVNAVTNKVKVPQLWFAETHNNTVQSLIDALDRSADIVVLGDAPGVITIRGSVALFVDKTDMKESMHVTLAISNQSNLFSSEFSEGELQDHAGIGIYLPSSIAKSTDKKIDRVWFTVHKTDKLFLSNTSHGTDVQITTNVVGIGIGNNYGNIRNLKDDIRIQFVPPIGKVFNPTARCVFWNVTNSTWSDTGVRTEVDTLNNRVVCQANHLTNFAVLMNVGNIQIAGIHLSALQTITIVGGSVSIVCLLLTVIGLSKFKAFRKTPTNQIHISLSFTLMMGLIFLLVGLDRTEDMTVCTIFAILIHFFYLSAVSWMMVEGVNLYIAFVKVFTGGQEHFYKKCAIFGFGFPTLIVFISVIVNFTTSQRIYADGQFCWLVYIPGLIAFVGPVIIMLIANIIIFAFVIKQIFWRKQPSTRGKMDSFKQLRAVLCLMALMGLGWIVGAFTVDGVSGLVFQYIFCITNISQGILIFYFHCASKPDVRNAWLNSFSTSSKFFKPTHSKSISSSYHPRGRESITIGAPKLADGVYNATCNIMGINVPLMKSTSSSEDSGYGYNPDNVSQEDRFTVDLKAHGSGKVGSEASVSVGGHHKHGRGNMGTVLPAATTNRTYSTAVTSNNKTRFRSKGGSSPRSPRTVDLMPEKKEDNFESPLFPPSASPPPPPSSPDTNSKDSFDMVSTPEAAASPPLIQFSEDETTTPPEHQATRPGEPSAPAETPPPDVLYTEPVFFDELHPNPEKGSSSESSPGSEENKELRGFSDEEEDDEEEDEEGSDESRDYATPDLDMDSQDPESEAKRLSWNPSKKKVKKRDVEIQRVKSFGTVKDNFEQDLDKLNPDRYKKRRQSLKSPCLPMKSLRGKFEQQRSKMANIFVEEEDEEEEEEEEERPVKQKKKKGGK